MLQIRSCIEKVVEAGGGFSNNFIRKCIRNGCTQVYLTIYIYPLIIVLANYKNCHPIYDA